MDARDELRLNTPDRGAKALEFETAVVGSMLLDDKCIGPLLPELDEEDFTHGPYRHLFAAMKAMFLAGRPVDPKTVCGYLRDDSKQMVYLMRQCMEVTPTAANAVYYARDLRAESRRLRRQELGYALSQEGRSRGITAALLQHRCPPLAVRPNRGPGQRQTWSRCSLPRCPARTRICRFESKGESHEDTDK